VGGDDHDEINQISTAHPDLVAGFQGRAGRERNEGQGGKLRGKGGRNGGWDGWKRRRERKERREKRGEGKGLTRSAAIIKVSEVRDPI